MEKLTPKQQRFVEEYLVDLNATRAAIDAGYSKKSARLIGCENITKPNIQEAIQKSKIERSERTKVTVDMVLKELATFGFSNIQDYLKHSQDDLAIFKSIDDMPENAARAIESIKVNTREGKIEFKLHNKPKGLELIGRHLGMFIDKIGFDKDSLPDKINVGITIDGNGTGPRKDSPDSKSKN